jgi:TolB-like protein
MTKESTIEPGLVREGIQKILEWEEFRNSPILCKFLEFVVEKTLDGEADQIKEYTIGVNGLNKGKDFNPQVDAYVRIHARRLRQALSKYYLTVGKNGVLIVDIPKGGYVPVFRVQTPDKVSQSNTHYKASEGNDNLNHLGRNRRLDRPVLAILPFQNLSGDDSKDFLVSGFAEQMSTELARFQHVAVISNCLTPCHSRPDYYETKQLNGIDYVITGSVRIHEDFLRLNVQLYSAENSQIVFSEKYSKQLTSENIFDIQEEIVGEILNAVADDDGIIAWKQFRSYSNDKGEDFVVKDAIHKYYRYCYDYNVDELPTTLEVLEKAVTEKPRDAYLSALLSLLYLETYVNQSHYEPDLLRKGTELALSSVRLDAECQHAQKALVWAYLLSQRREKTLEAIDQCIRLNPKAGTIMSSMALAYVCLGEFEQGFELLRQISRLNHIIRADAKLAFALYHFHKGNFQESLKWTERLWHLKSTFIKILRLSLTELIARPQNSIISVESRGLIRQSESIVGRLIMDGELKDMFMSSLGRAKATA